MKSYYLYDKCLKIIYRKWKTCWWFCLHFSTNFEQLKLVSLKWKTFFFGKMHSNTNFNTSKTRNWNVGYSRFSIGIFVIEKLFLEIVCNLMFFVRLFRLHKRIADGEWIKCDNAFHSVTWHFNCVLVKLLTIFKVNR